MNAAKLTKKYMMLIVLILLIVFFSIFGENFLSVENAITVCRQVRDRHDVRPFDSAH